MKTNPLKEIEKLGQAIWLDFIKRDLMSSGQLKKFINEDGLHGMTSNPNIFEKAITESQDYESDIKKLASAGKNVEAIYEALTVKDVQDAADEFRALYQQLNTQDGYVSYEVNPHLAHDTQGTIEEARRLWKTLNRPNVLIKVPATKEGLPAITQLISEGINVNVTLLFGLPRYREVALAYITGIEERIKKGQDVKNISSVASFFLSRIDVLLDPRLEEIINKQNAQSSIAKEIQGQMAIASANMAYQIYHEIFTHQRFKQIAEKGARRQRVLWASTSTKNPQYSDVKYVEALIGPETVDTMPLETLNAYRDHGKPQIRLGLDNSKMKRYFELLAQLGISIDQATQQLENEGVDKFNKAYDQLLAALKKKI